MAVPKSCTVLVIGGGPAGSYAATSLAREGISTVVLEADKFPRYHVGESTLPSLRPFFQLSGVYDAIKSHGFNQKNGAVFRLAQGKPEGFTNFIEAGGPEGYAWNVVRSDFDDILLRHAASSGAEVIQETEVKEIRFASESSKDRVSNGGKVSDDLCSLQPESASWTCRDGSSGSIAFKYLVDASGRKGILSNKYLKNRTVNDNFKNVANWAYWESDTLFGIPGTPMHGSPYFEALKDASGWVWFIPLHDGTRSVGIVQDQTLARNKKRELGSPPTLDYYKEALKGAPTILSLLDGASLKTDIKSASDWSYTASTYHLRNARICGDAGSFIDPLFSSGVHLAITGGLSAAATIAASIRGDCDEQTAGMWHSKKTISSYSRFYLAVSSASKQIRHQDLPILQDLHEDGFQRAFDLFRPIIQGTVDADVANSVTQDEVYKVFELCSKSFTPVKPHEKEALFAKLEALGFGESDQQTFTTEKLRDLPKNLTADELQALRILQTRRLTIEDPFEMDSFTLDPINGMVPNLVRGSLGLVKADQGKIDKKSLFSLSFLRGKEHRIREG